MRATTDSEKVVEARKEGLAKFMASVAAVAGSHPVVQEFCMGADSTYDEVVSGVGEVDPTPGEQTGDVEASWSKAAGALDELGSPEVTVAAVRMQDASALERMRGSVFETSAARRWDFKTDVFAPLVSRKWGFNTDVFETLVARK